MAIRIYNPTDLSTKTVLFYDYGLFICIAEKLAEKFGKVYYYTPWKNDFPTYETAWIGRGARGGVERIKDFFEVLDKLDKENTLIFFPDIYNSDLQEDLRRQGYRMIGAGEAEKFERDKWLFKKILKELGLPVANTVRIVGLKHLRELLSGLGNKWLKTSEFRGDFETREHVNMERTNMWLDKITCKMVPPRRNTIEILVEDPIEGDVEPGVDMFLSNGVPSEYCTIGYEVKGVGMISRTFKTQELPKNLKSANDKVIALMPEYKGPYSAEFRIDKNGTVYYVDPAMRFGSPLAEMQCEFYDNFAESMWEISEGKAPSFRPIAKYAVQIVMYSEYLLKRPIIVEYPEEAAKWFKMRDYCIVDGITYCIPNPSGDSTVGSVFGFANNLDEAIKLAEDRTDKINGDGLTWDTDVGVEAKKYIKDGEKHGIYF